MKLKTVRTLKTSLTAALVAAGCLSLGGCGGGSGATSSPVTQNQTVDPALNQIESVSPPPASPGVVEQPLSLPTNSASSGSQWGTYQKPFSADSPWNIRPLNPVLGSAEIPTALYFPTVQEGSYSVGVFQASNSDQPMVVLGPVGSAGIWDPDSERFQVSVTIPRWPASTTPASGSDGHADIVDATAGVVHSFHKLQLVDGQWRASQYGWSKLNGRGWGDASHYFQGARASGAPTSGGLIRTHEINDGDTMYRHALAMSLSNNGLASSPIYTFPATSSDTDAATANTGAIPMGSLMMLPSDFDTSTISNLDLRKVAETLKTYGSYVVDRNSGTPFFIYAELGSGFNLHKNGWSTVTANDLHTIRSKLRPVLSAGSWINGNGATTNPIQNFNLLSMRGAWTVTSGSTVGSYDTWKQAVVFPSSSTPTTQVNYSPNVFSRLLWVKPSAGISYKLTAQSTGGAKIRLQLTDCSANRLNVDSGLLQDGQSATFVWPQQMCESKLTAVSGSSGPSTVQATLTKATP